MRLSKLITLTGCLWIGVSYQYILSAQDSRLQILDKFVEKRAQFQSITYEIVLGMKIFTAEDTIVSTANVEMVRNVNDSLYGGIFTITIQDSIRYSYDGQKIRKAELDSAIVTIGDPHANPGLWVQSTWVDNFLDYGFLKLTPGPIAMINDSTVETTFCDTMIGEWPCVGVFLRFPDEGELENRVFFTAIDTIEYMVRSRMYSVYFQENEQYTNWFYKNIQYSNDTTIGNLDNAFLLSFQSTELYDPDTSSALIQPELNYTIIEGKVWGKDELFRLADVKEKLIILDFWYTSCYPCIKALPAVNKLYHDYKDKGVDVFGINMFDDELKDKSRLEKFFRNNAMDYQAIMINKDLAKEIKIASYPTLMVLDENYQVVFMEEGFSENLYTEVAEFLDSRL